MSGCCRIALALAKRPTYLVQVSKGREVHKPFGPAEMVQFEPVRDPDGAVDVDATLALLDRRFASESLRYRFSPFRRMHRVTLRAALSRANR